MSEKSQNWSVLWACSNIKSQFYQQLCKNQMVNHFPKSTEMTRKDSMYRNLDRLRELHGERHFRFLPKTYILPSEMLLLQEAMLKHPQKSWICKPASSSQGKGIFITQDVNEIPDRA